VAVLYIATPKKGRVRWFAYLIKNDLASGWARVNRINANTQGSIGVHRKALKSAAWTFHGPMVL
jgi:hypothetical protein